MRAGLGVSLLKHQCGPKIAQHRQIPRSAAEKRIAVSLQARDRATRECTRGTSLAARAAFH